MSKFYTTKDMAEMLEVSPQTIINWEGKSEIPVATRFGHQGRLRWLKVKADPWLIRKGFKAKATDATA